ncbi:hypothetical protein D3C84_1177810 [compost metagenome]
MCAQADKDEDFRLDRTNLRVDVGGLYRGLGLGVSQVTDDLFQVTEDLVRSPHDEHRLATPLGHHLLPGLDLGDIDLHRCTRGFRLGTGKP